MMNKIKEEFNKVEMYQKIKYPLLKGCIEDGILIPEAYGKSPLKMMVVLKEPFDAWDEETQSPIGGDFCFADIIRNLEYEYNKGLNKTWLKVAAMAYAIKHGIPYSENLTLEEVREGLSCICWINLSKTPWKTQSDVKDKNYLSRVKDWESVVKEQLKSIDYNLILYGYTWDCSLLNPIEPDKCWDYTKVQDKQDYTYCSESGKKYGVQIFKYQGSDKIIVNGYHPELGNSASWQTDFIQNYINRYGL